MPRAPHAKGPPAPAPTAAMSSWGRATSPWRSPRRDLAGTPGPRPMSPSVPVSIPAVPPPPPASVVKSPTPRGLFHPDGEVSQMKLDAALKQTDEAMRLRKGAEATAAAERAERIHLSTVHATEIQSMRREVEEAHSTVRKLQLEILDARNDGEAAETRQRVKLREMEHENETLRLQCVAVQEQLAAVSADNEMLSGNSQQLRVEIDRLKVSLEEMQGRNGTLRDSLAMTVQELTAQIEQSADGAALSDLKIRTLESELSRHHQQQVELDTLRLRLTDSEGRLVEYDGVAQRLTNQSTRLLTQRQLASLQRHNGVLLGYLRAGFQRWLLFWGCARINRYRMFVDDLTLAAERLRGELFADMAACREETQQQLLVMSDAALQQTLAMEADLQTARMNNAALQSALDAMTEELTQWKIRAADASARTVREEHLQELEEKLAEKDKELDEVHKKWIDEQAEASQLKLLAEKARQGREEAEEMLAKKKEELEEMRKRWLDEQAQLQTLKDAADTARRAQRDAEDAASKGEREHKELVGKLRIELSDALAKKDLEMADALAAKDRDTREALAKVEREAREALNKKERELNEMHQRWVEEQSRNAQLATTVDSLQSAKDAAEKALSRLKQETDAAYQKLSHESEAALAKARQERETSLAHTRQEGDAALAKLKQESEAALAKLSHESEAALAKAKQEGADALWTLERENADQVAGLRREHDAALARQRQDGDAATAALQRAADERAAALQRELDEVRAENDRQRKLLMEAQGNHMMSEEERKRAEDAAAAELTRLQNETAEARRKADAEKKRVQFELDEARRAAADERRRWTEDAESERRRLKDRQDALTRDVDDLQARLRAALDEAAAANEALRAEKDARDKAERDAADLAAERNDIFEQLKVWEARLDERRRDRDRLSGEMSELEEELNRVNALNQQLQATVKADKAENDRLSKLVAEMNSKGLDVEKLAEALEDSEERARNLQVVVDSYDADMREKDDELERALQRGMALAEHHKKVEKQYETQQYIIQSRPKLLSCIVGCLKLNEKAKKEWLTLKKDYIRVKEKAERVRQSEHDIQGCYDQTNPVIPKESDRVVKVWDDTWIDEPRQLHGKNPLLVLEFIICNFFTDIEKRHYGLGTARFAPFAVTNDTKAALRATAQPVIATGDVPMNTLPNTGAPGSPLATAGTTPESRISQPGAGGDAAKRWMRATRSAQMVTAIRKVSGGLQGGSGELSPATSPANRRSTPQAFDEPPKTPPTRRSSKPRLFREASAPPPGGSPAKEPTSPAPGSQARRLSSEGPLPRSMKRTGGSEGRIASPSAAEASGLAFTALLESKRKGSGSSFRTKADTIGKRKGSISSGVVEVMSQASQSSAKQ